MIEIVMPRKGYLASNMFRLESDTKEAIIEAVKAHVVPLYEAAARNLSGKGENYYWE